MSEKKCCIREDENYNLDSIVYCVWMYLFLMDDSWWHISCMMGMLIIKNTISLFSFSQLQYAGSCYLTCHTVVISDRIETTLVAHAFTLSSLISSTREWFFVRLSARGDASALCALLVVCLRVRGEKSTAITVARRTRRTEKSQIAETFSFACY